MGVLGFANIRCKFKLFKLFFVVDGGILYVQVSHIWGINKNAVKPMSQKILIKPAFNPASNAGKIFFQNISLGIFF